MDRKQPKGKNKQIKKVTKKDMEVPEFKEEMGKG